MRTGTANTYNTALQQLYQRQSELASQQEKLASAKKVNRASDDPQAAARAERALMGISRLETDQRALEVQRGAISSAESTLGDATTLVQSFRDLVINAGNAGYSAADRTILARQMADLRDQLLTIANRNDSNGVPLFGGLGSTIAPFADLPSGVQYQAIAGQRAATTDALPGAMNGQAIWMDVPSGNGSFEVSLNNANTGGAWTDAGTVTSPAALTGDNYSVTFNVVAGVTTYAVVNTSTSTTVASGQPYADGAPIQFDGMSVMVHGVPASGDAVSVAPSTRSNIFKVLDDAIRSVDTEPGGNRMSQAVALQLSQIDTGLEKIQSARSQAGVWLNRADTISGAQEARSTALATDKSHAVDLDMVKGISDFNMAQTGYQAALQSYAQIQKLSLFNFIN
ncbi:MAG: flagellar hook-associated protein FlgL [Burkholderiaceae bacterium]